MNRVKVVIVGCGKVAGGYNEKDETKLLTHMMAYRHLGARVLGCCDVNPIKSRQFARRWSIPNFGTQLRDILRSVKPDVVSVCTPPHNRLGTLRTIFGCESVKSVLLEKPIADNGQQAVQIVEELKKWGRPVLVNYFRAYDPFYRNLASWCRGGAWGPVTEVVARYYGTALTNASHMLERVLAIAGNVSSVKNWSNRNPSPHFEILFERPKMRATFLPTSGCAYSPLEFDIFFTRGRLRVVDSEQRIETFSSKKDRIFPGFQNLVRVSPLLKGFPSHAGIRFSVKAAIDASLGKSREHEKLLERSLRVSTILDKVLAEKSHREVRI